jgi:hypothetical protein
MLVKLERLVNLIILRFSEVAQIRMIPALKYLLVKVEIVVD